MTKKKVDAQTIIALHKSGKAIGEICLDLGISRNTATRRLVMVGYDTRREAANARKVTGGIILLDGAYTVPVSKDLVAVVDAVDYEAVSRHCWCPLRHKDHQRTIIYAQANIEVNGEWRRVTLHRFILSAPIGSTVDHKDGDGLNCRRGNMRLATHGQNMQNSSVRRGRFKGVSWHKKANKWVAQIMADCKHYYLGLFEREEHAAKAYDMAAKELHGEYAKLNFPI